MKGGSPSPTVEVGTSRHATTSEYAGCAETDREGLGETSSAAVRLQEGGSRIPPDGQDAEVECEGANNFPRGTTRTILLPQYLSSLCILQADA